MSQTQLLLRGGTVHDGLGSPSRIADVLVRGDRIAAVGVGLDTSDVAIVDCSVDYSENMKLTCCSTTPSRSSCFRG